jgi:regulator of RNase E activity RraA
MFERFDTGTVSDALDRLAMVGAIQSVSRLTTDRTVVGYAVTVQLGPDDGSPSERHLCTAAIEAGDDRSVIVVAGGRLDCGGWGGLLSRAASYKGIRGVIVDGASRDVDEAAAIGLPVFARRAACATARGRQREVGSGEPVVVDGVRIAPGDVVVADGSGLVVVPRADALRVVEAATAIHEREQEMAARIGAGETVSAVLGGNYESMLNRKE